MFLSNPAVRWYMFGEGHDRRSILKLLGAAPFISLESLKTKNPVAAGAKAQTGVIENQRLRIEFSNNGGVTRVYSKETDIEMVDPSGGWPPISWTITLYSDEYDGLSAGSHRTRSGPEISTVREDNKVSIKLEWEDPYLSAWDDGSQVQIDEYFDAKITVTVSLGDGDPLSYWDISIQNQSSRAVNEVNCPAINNITTLDPDGEDALIPSLVV